MWWTDGVPDLNRHMLKNLVMPSGSLAWSAVIMDETFGLIDFNYFYMESSPQSSLAKGANSIANRCPQYCGVCALLPFVRSCCPSSPSMRSGTTGAHRQKSSPGLESGLLPPRALCLVATQKFTTRNTQTTTHRVSYHFRVQREDVRCS